ncbi:hypothetical protein IE53DRAFT_367533 [Violaceomyces palustris]|uniref:Uncharacterized protein n=1 Tax=Violaceomyces palustris TaxID=1673888 RepID=A0ACD0P1Y6_9BASI|nr:hypothetical protein IE53DRAFT_367533 [Violaceomyces palustris]
MSKVFFWFQLMLALLSLADAFPMRNVVDRFHNDNAEAHCKRGLADDPRLISELERFSLASIPKPVSETTPPRVSGREKKVRFERPEIMELAEERSNGKPFEIITRSMSELVSSKTERPGYVNDLPRSVKERLLRDYHPRNLHTFSHFFYDNQGKLADSWTSKEFYGPLGTNAKSKSSNGLWRKAGESEQVFDKPNWVILIRSGKGERRQLFVYDDKNMQRITASQSEHFLQMQTTDAFRGEIGPYTYPNHSYDHIYRDDQKGTETRFSSENFYSPLTQTSNTHWRNAEPGENVSGELTWTVIDRNKKGEENVKTFVYRRKKGKEVAREEESGESRWNLHDHGEGAGEASTSGAGKGRFVGMANDHYTWDPTMSGASNQVSREKEWWGLLAPVVGATKSSKDGLNRVKPPRQEWEQLGEPQSTINWGKVRSKIGSVLKNQASLAAGAKAHTSTSLTEKTQLKASEDIRGKGKAEESPDR